MANPNIKIKRSAVPGKRPTVDQLPLGELGLNTYDGQLFAQVDTGGVGIATTVSSLTPWKEDYGGTSISYDNNVSVGSTLTVQNFVINGTVSAASSTGLNGQYLQSTGVGVTWSSFPTFRNVSNFTATTGQTTFSVSYSVGFVDVYVNGVRLADSEYTATNGSTVVLNESCFGQENVDIIAYNTVNTAGSGGGGGSGGSGISLTDLSVTVTSVGISTLSYNNSNGVFTYTPPNLTGYATTDSIVGLASVSYVNTQVGLATAGLLSLTGNGSRLTGIVTSITADSGISINQSTGNVTITGTGVTTGSNTTYTGNNTFSGITTFSGNVFTTSVLQVQQVEETYNSYTSNIGVGATVALDCSTGNTFYISTGTVSGNWTANLTNLALAANCLTNVTLMIEQGATAHIPTALQIGGVAQTINWQGGSVPGGNNSKKDAIAFTIFYTGSVYNVFGQLVTFG